MNAEVIKKIHPDIFYGTFLDNNLRPDGRKFIQSRILKVSLNGLNNYEVSSNVRLGNTSVACGLKWGISQCSEKPRVDELFQINFEISKESQMISDIEILERQTRSVKKSLSVALCALFKEHIEEFIIEENLKLKTIEHWVIIVDIVCLSKDGNLTDTILTGVMCLLGKLQFPVLEKDTDGEYVIDDGAVSSKSLKLVKTVYSFTFAIVGGCHIIYDPNHNEEASANCTFSVSIMKPTDEILVEKVSGQSLKVNLMQEAITIARNLVDKTALPDLYANIGQIQNFSDTLSL